MRVPVDAFTTPGHVIHSETVSTVTNGLLLFKLTISYVTNAAESAIIHSHSLGHLQYLAA